MLNDYQLHLPQFEGPLDVLLRLIERSQLAITDLSLMLVTEQFLVHVRGLGESVPPQAIAEFTAVGARLTLLKSRSLLPRPPIEEVEDDPGDLTRQLAEYRQFKQMASTLSDRLAAGTGCFGPESARVVWRDPVPARLAHYEPAMLVRAIRRRLSLLPRPATLFRPRPLVTLPQMVGRIVACFRAGSRISFGQVLDTCQTRSEAATAFLALLVLHRRQVIATDQPELFGEIHLTRQLNIGDGAIDDAVLEADAAFANAPAGEPVLAGIST